MNTEIDKSKESCRNSIFDIIDHFDDIVKMVEMGSGAQREQEDIGTKQSKLS